MKTQRQNSNWIFKKNIDFSMDRRITSETRVLSKFMDIQFDLNKKSNSKKSVGPIVTISRDKGCHAAPIAELLLSRLNGNKNPIIKKTEWRLLSKDILEESAKKLQLNPEKLEEILNKKESSIFEEMLLTLLGDNYPDERKILNTIRDVVLTAAVPGFLLILGRGGMGITRKLPNTFHIKLTAPLDWRIKQLAKNYKCTRKKAIEHIKAIDAKRKHFRSFYFGTETAEDHFDLIFNLSSITPAELVESIYSIIKVRTS